MFKTNLVSTILTLYCALFSVQNVTGQTDRWQQRVNYKMDVSVNAEKNTFVGTQKLEYWNNLIIFSSLIPQLYVCKPI